MTGAVFGESYKAMLTQGDVVMDSLDAGAALAALRAQAPERAVHWAHELQAAFYGRGESLSEPAIVSAIAKANGLNDELVLRQLADGSAKAQARADFDLAHNVLGAHSYPTLLFVNKNEVHKLPATGTTLSTLNQSSMPCWADRVTKKRPGPAIRRRPSCLASAWSRLRGRELLVEVDFPAEASGSPWCAAGSRCKHVTWHGRDR